MSVSPMPYVAKVCSTFVEKRLGRAAGAWPRGVKPRVAAGVDGVDADEDVCAAVVAVPDVGTATSASAVRGGRQTLSLHAWYFRCALITVALFFSFAVKGISIVPSKTAIFSSPEKENFRTVCGGKSAFTSSAVAASSVSTVGSENSLRGLFELTCQPGMITAVSLPCTSSPLREVTVPLSFTSGVVGMSGAPETEICAETAPASRRERRGRILRRTSYFFPVTRICCSICGST